MGLPVHTASWLYALGRDEVLLAERLRLAATVGARTHNIMLYWHDANGRPISKEWDLSVTPGLGDGRPSCARTLRQGSISRSQLCGCLHTEAGYRADSA